MGREIKRVPLDFDWPLNETWEGFLNPHYKRCRWCECGETDAGARFSDFMRALVELGVNSRLRPEGFTAQRSIEGRIHRERRCRWPWHEHDLIVSLKTIAKWDKPLSEEDQQRLLNIAHCWFNPRDVLVYEPITCVQVRAGLILNPTGEDFRRGRRFPFPSYLLGTDGIGDPGSTIHEFIEALGIDIDGAIDSIGMPNTWNTRVAIQEYVGVEENWWACRACGGEGIDPTTYDDYKAWEETPVPVGPGYQIWETVSEGSPVSPVFKSKEDLVEWLVEQGTARESAEGFANSEWVPSFMATDGGFYATYDTTQVAGTREGVGDKGEP
jgi:hypothetical protein